MHSHLFDVSSNTWEWCDNRSQSISASVCATFSLFLHVGIRGPRITSGLAQVNATPGWSDFIQVETGILLLLNGDDIIMKVAFRGKLALQRDLGWFIAPGRRISLPKAPLVFPSTHRISVGQLGRNMGLVGGRHMGCLQA